MSIATPEGLTLDLELAGPGSRSAAALIDHAVIIVLLIGAFALVFDVGSGVTGFAVLLLVIFGLMFGYFIVFEMFWQGQSPGKWLMHLRVLHDDGSAVGWRASGVRNLVRIVDFLPASYLIGLIALIGSRRDQRLGDLAAGTIVVRQLRVSSDRGTVTFDMPRPEGWDVTGVSPEEIAVVRHFLLRRNDLPADTRYELATTLRQRLGSRVIGADRTMLPEEFLEAVAGARASSR